jgi:hypothetical protein
MGNDLRGLFPNSKMAQAKRMGLSDLETGSGTLDTLISDDFGGTTLNAANWTVLPGGLGLNPNLGKGPLTQPAIGSGITGGMTYNTTTTASALTVNMGTTLGEELWFLAPPILSGKEDILVLLSKSQALAANSIFIGMVEVDPTTGIPLYNANFALDGNGSGEFANRGGVEFGLTATATAYQCEAIGDSSSAKATGAVGTAAAWTAVSECFIEIESHDIIASTCVPDTSAAKLSTASRVSSQVPNDTKFYKLVMRFKNVTTPGSSTVVTIPRIAVEDNDELRVQITTGEGDANPQKAVPVIITGPNTGVSNTNNLGLMNPTAIGTLSQGSFTRYHLVALATTNANSVKGSSGKIFGGVVANTTTTVLYFKLFDKASAPTLGTDTPVFTLAVPPNSAVTLADIVSIYGMYFSTGIAIAVTNLAADSDATAVAAGACVLTLLYL